MKNIGFILYEFVQPMDVIGPWEVLSFWKNTLKAPVNMYLISENGAYVQCSDDIILKSHFDFDHAPQLDYLIIPGGKGRLKQIENEKYLNFIKKQSKKAKYLISICTGTFLLYQAGLLKNKSTTTYWRAIPELKHLPDIKIEEKRIVKDGNVWSSGGISSGIDLAFELIEEIAGKEVAGAVQLLFEYFPRNKIFVSEKSIDHLPEYYTKDAGQTKPDLPQYIKDYLNAKTSDA